MGTLNFSGNTLGGDFIYAKGPEMFFGTNCVTNQWTSWEFAFRHLAIITYGYI